VKPILEGRRSFCYTFGMIPDGSSSIGRAPGCDPGDEGFEPPLSPQSLYWLAGLLEGEGSFLKPPPSKPTRVILSIEMTDRDVLERVADLLGVGVYDVPSTERTRRWRPSHRVILHNEKAARLMRELRPLMGSRRQHQIDAALAAREAALSTRNHPRLNVRHYREIARRLAAGERAVDLSAEFGITREYVYRVAKRGRAA
jgi:hypothetical protein